MALKIGGTTVINDSRGLENISNLKTVNGQSIVGTGDILISPGTALPAQTGNDGKVLSTDGANPIWVVPSSQASATPSGTVLLSKNITPPTGYVELNSNSDGVLYIGGSNPNGTIIGGETFPNESKYPDSEYTTIVVSGIPGCLTSIFGAIRLSNTKFLLTNNLEYCVIDVPLAGITPSGKQIVSQGTLVQSIKTPPVGCPYANYSTMRIDSDTIWIISGDARPIWKYTQSTNSFSEVILSGIGTTKLSWLSIKLPGRDYVLSFDFSDTIKAVYKLTPGANTFQKVADIPAEYCQGYDGMGMGAVYMGGSTFVGGSSYLCMFFGVGTSRRGVVHFNDVTNTFSKIIHGTTSTTYSDVPQPLRYPLIWEVYNPPGASQINKYHPAIVCSYNGLQTKVRYMDSFTGVWGECRYSPPMQTFTVGHSGMTSTNAITGGIGTSVIYVLNYNYGKQLDAKYIKT